MQGKVSSVIKKFYDETAFGALGIVFDKVGLEETTASLLIDHRHLQPLGLVHGGIYVVLSESVASIAAMCAINLSLQSVVAIEINANHLRPAKEGHLIGIANIIHQGKKTLVYETKITNHDKLISIGRCTLMKVDYNKETH